ncbi:MAG: hypothetical protein ACTSR2_02160 [Candidatus Hodarchaeales archaeon]
MIPATVLALIVLAGLGSAGLLTYYGMITGTATVEQSVKVDGKDVNIGSLDIKDNIPEPAPGGERFCFKHTLENQASVPATVGFETLYDPDGEGIKKIIYELPAKTTLILENKDTSWQPITSDVIQATLTFDTVDPKFNYELEATGLTPSTSYSLIYYADEPDRFVNWGGSNPGALIATVTSDGSGAISSSGSTDLNMNLPCQPDWNINPIPNYCNNANGYDSYKHCSGAKIWLVPTAALPDPYPDDGSWAFWDTTGILFETDLITYFDCDKGVEYYLAEMGGTEITGDLTLESEETMPILTCYDFAINIAPDTYIITTNIVPVA